MTLCVLLALAAFPATARAQLGQTQPAQQSSEDDVSVDLTGGQANAETQGRDKDTLVTGNKNEDAEEEERNTLDLTINLIGGRTDRVLLDDPLTNKTSGDFYAVEPELQVHLKNRKLALDLDYTPQIIHFDQQDRTEVRHNGRLDARMDVVEDLLSFYAGATVGQQIRARGFNITGSPYNIAQERGTIQTYTAGPTLQSQFRNGTVVEALYRYGITIVDGFDEDENNQQVNQQVNLQNSKSHTAVFNLSRRFSEIGVEVGTTSDFAYLNVSNGSDFQRLNSRAELLVDVFDALKLVGAVGYYDLSDRAGLQGSTQFLAGIQIDGRWVTARFLGGRRGQETIFEGELRANIGKSVSIDGSYRDDYDTSQTLQLAEEFNPLDPNFDPTLFLDPTLDRFDLTNVVFRQKTGNLAISWENGPLLIALNGGYSERSSNSEEFRGLLNLGDTYSAGSRLEFEFQQGLSARLSGTYFRSNFSGTDRREDTVRADAELVWSVSDRIDVSALFSFGDRSSNVAEFDGNENVGYLRLTTRF